MDVRCSRCSTEYEFDDGLISGRGTTVQCTNCGFQFRLFPTDSGALPPERWVVRTASGREHVFTSLRELQRGISEQNVGPHDLLSRGQQTPRPLGSIAELEQFFLSPHSPGPPQAAPQGAARRVGAPGRTLPPPDFFPSPSEEEQSSPEPNDRANSSRSTSPLGSLPDVDSDAVTLRTTGRPEARVSTSGAPEVLSGSSPSSQKMLAATPLVVLPAEELVSGHSGVPSSVAPPRAPAGSQPEPWSGSLGLRAEPWSGNLGTRAEPRSNPRSSTPIALPPVSSGRRDLRSYDEISVDGLPEPGRRARSRWIAAVVIAGVVTLFALTIGRRYLTDKQPSAAVPQEQSSGKVAALLKTGNQLMDEGHLEEAGEELTRAGALAERDPEVLAALARLSVLRADVFWLKLRLIDPTVLEHVQSIQRELGRRTGKARSSVDAAFAVAPENLVVLRARVDALRLSGDHDAAREWIKPIASRPSDPENAYVLAALDLAEAEPSWPTVIDRLKTGVAGERSPGRAHAALVYALIRANRSAEAEAELAKLESDPTGGLLGDELRSYFQRQARSVGAQPPPKASANLPSDTPDRPGASGADAQPTLTNDFRRLLEQASVALRGGNLERADTLYQQVLTQQPGNTEALAGLGDVARRRDDPATAARMYERVLAKNPNYIPAMLARADQKWDDGDRNGALVLYRRVLDQAGIGTDYGQRASVRIAQAARAEAEERRTPTAPSTPPTQDPSAPPGIDTTDLPELQ